MPQPAAPVAVFCSFAPEDEPLCLDLERRLKHLHRRGILTLWHRGHIPTGADRASAVADALKRAALILLLISPDYLSFDDCFEVELVRAMHRHERSTAMFNVCPRCGEYVVEKIIDPSGPYAICPICHYAHLFLQQPLFIITGPSGGGKTTVCLELVSLLKECVVLDADILWGVLSPTAENGYLEFRNLCLRVAKNVGQAGRPVVLGGTALPEQFEVCPERRYFSTLHYLALVCDDATLRERLKARPAWRASGSDEVVEDMVQLNRWYKEHATTTNPPMTLYDSSHRSIRETAQEVAQWIRERL